MEEIVDYYQVGSKEDIVVSSSSLKHIDPLRGGSPLSFLDFLENGGGANTAATRKGTLIHKWHEDKDNFKIAEINKPSEKLGVIADEVIKLVQEGNDYTDGLLTYVIDKFEYQRNWKPETRLNKVRDEIHPYVNEVLTAKENNQVFMTATEIEPVMNACEAIENHPVARKLLFYQENEIDNIKAYTEVEVYWTTTRVVKINGEQKEVLVKCKAKIDKLIIDFDKRIIKIVDLKSTGRGVYDYNETNFKTYKTYQQLAFYLLASIQFYNQIKGTEIFPDNWNFEYYIVGVETNKLQQCVVYSIDKQWIYLGLKEVNKLLNRIAWHQETKKWSYSIEEEKNNYILEIPYVEDIEV